MSGLLIVPSHFSHCQLLGLGFVLLLNLRVFVFVFLKKFTSYLLRRQNMNLVWFLSFSPEAKLKSIQKRKSITFKTCAPKLGSKLWWCKTLKLFYLLSSKCEPYKSSILITVESHISRTSVWSDSSSDFNFEKKNASSNKKILLSKFRNHLMRHKNEMDVLQG